MAFAVDLYQLGVAYFYLKRYEDADKALQQGLPIAEAKSEADPGIRQNILKLLALTYQELGLFGGVAYYQQRLSEGYHVYGRRRSPQKW